MKLHASRMGLLSAAAAVVMGLTLTVSAPAWSAPNATNQCSIELLAADAAFKVGLAKLIAQACLAGNSTVDSTGLTNLVDSFAARWNQAITDNGAANCIEEDDGMAESAESVSASEELADASAEANAALVAACVNGGSIDLILDVLGISDAGP